MKETLVATTALLATAGTTALAHADVERRGTCAGATYELDLDTFRRNTAGKDVFKLTVTPAGGASCSVKATLR